MNMHISHTLLKENLIKIVFTLCAIVLAIVSWGATQIYSLNREVGKNSTYIENINETKEEIKNHVNEIDKKLNDKLNDKIKGVTNDVDRLENRMDNLIDNSKN